MAEDEKTEKKITKKRAVKKSKKEPSEGGKIKPKLDKETRELLEKRQQRRSKQPEFNRFGWYRYKRLDNKWKRPRGLESKQRLNKKYRTPKANTGYGKPSKVRGLHPSGFKEVLVHRPSDVESVDPKVQAIRIGATVGTRKRKDIVDEADKRNIRVLNRGVL